MNRPPCLDGPGCPGARCPCAELAAAVQAPPAEPPTEPTVTDVPTGDYL